MVNLFELSKNFHNRGPEWLVERYIQQQHPLSSVYPQTPAPTTSLQQRASAHQSIPQQETGTPQSQGGYEPREATQAYDNTQNYDNGSQSARSMREAEMEA